LHHSIYGKVKHVTLTLFLLISFVSSLFHRKDQPFMIQESQIMDKFEKYNNNSGYCAPNPTLSGTNHAAVQAFSHWTHTVSNERMMVVDMQGGHSAINSCFMLTDPAIHFVDVTHFGGTNMGRPGMAKFFETHSCNEYCQYLRLVKPLP
jgi:hypothetical protein